VTKEKGDSMNVLYRCSIPIPKTILITCSSTILFDLIYSLAYVMFKYAFAS